MSTEITIQNQEQNQNQKEITVTWLSYQFNLSTLAPHRFTLLLDSMDQWLTRSEVLFAEGKYSQDFWDITEFDWLNTRIAVKAAMKIRGLVEKDCGRCGKWTAISKDRGECAKCSPDLVAEVAVPSFPVGVWVGVAGAEVNEKAA